MVNRRGPTSWKVLPSSGLQAHCARGRNLFWAAVPKGFPKEDPRSFLSSVAPQGRVRDLTAHARPYKSSALGCSRGETGRGGSTRQGKHGWARCPAGSPVGGEAEAGDPGLLGIQNGFSTLGSFPSCPSPLAAQDVGTALCPAGQPALGKLPGGGPTQPGPRSPPPSGGTRPFPALPQAARLPFPLVGGNPGELNQSIPPP